MQSSFLRSRKRQHPEEVLARPHVKSKRQKYHADFVNLPPPEFWDNLIHIPLTKRALRELSRRQGSPEPLNLVENSEKDLQRFARRGGPDLRDLRGYRIEDQAMQRGRPNSRSRRPVSARTNTTKSTTPYDRAFDQHLTQHGIYPAEYEDENGVTLPEPSNLQEMQQRALQPRKSLSPTRFTSGDFKEFRRQSAAARKEKQVSESVIPLIEGKIKLPKCRSGGLPFNNFEPLTDGTIVPGNPDIYHGCRPEQFRKGVPESLHHLVVPSTQHDLPALPNFFLAVKGPGGVTEVAERQARYDGALGARAMSATLAYQQGNSHADQNAYTITSVFSSATLTMYTSHQIQGVDRREYVMTPVGAWAMAGSLQTFIQGASAYRNLRDWAEEQRNSAIKAAKLDSQLAEAEDDTEDESEEPEEIAEASSSAKGKRIRTSNRRFGLQRSRPPPKRDVVDSGESSVDELAL